MGITVPAHPCCILYLSSDKCIPQLRKICLNSMLCTLLIWKRYSSKYSLSSPCSPLVNILFNPKIPDSLSYDSMLPWTQAGTFQLRHLVHPVTRKLLSFSDLQFKNKIPKILFYSFLQIKHFFITRTPQITLDVPTEFEMLCSRGPHQVSTIYKILHMASPISKHSHSYMKRWSLILHRPISLVEWGKIWDANSKVSRCVVQRETAYKILMFWYRTPEFLAAHKLSPHSYCWRCSSYLGTHYHIFWECSIITPFWSQVHGLLEKVLEIPIPIHLLLRLPLPKITKPLNKLMAFILLAAKCVIPQCWLATTPPTFAQFLSAIADIRRMENLKAVRSVQI